MGYRATTNTLLNFGEGLDHAGRDPRAPSATSSARRAVASAYMFHMMNEARVSVGAGAVALGYTGYLHALDYARGRTQGRPLQDKDPSAPPVRWSSTPTYDACCWPRSPTSRAAWRWSCSARASSTSPGPLRTPAVAAEAEQLLGLLTPIAKSWPSQWCLAANDLAIQVHGGYGYTRDYPVEQFYRDNRLNPIHEGTHGIQALDLLGRKVVERDGAALVLLGQRLRATTRAATAAGGEVASYASRLDAAWDDVLRVTAALWAKGDPALALANASVYLEALGHVVVAWLWLEQLVAVGGKTGRFYDGKRAAARYFFAFELPTVAPKLALLESLDTTTLDLDPDVL